MFWLIVIVIIALCVVWSKYKNYGASRNYQENKLEATNERKAKEQRIRAMVKYRDNLDPYPHASQSYPIYLDQGDLTGASYLGLSNLHKSWAYMFVNINNYRIAFPESQYGAKQQYYLLNVDFKPKYSYTEQTSGNGNIQENTNGSGKAFDVPLFDRSYNDINTSTNGSVNYQGNGKINKVEQPSNALLTFAPVNLSRSFRLKIAGVRSSNISYLKEYFVLGQLERQRLGIK